MVVVQGMIPAGAGPGAVFDVTVEPLDTAVSLEGGFLHEVELRRYVTKESGPISGEIVAKASGPVTAGATGPTVVAATANKRNGMVFEGGKYDGERFLVLSLDKRYAAPYRAVLMEYMLNKRFRDVGREPGGTPRDYATALSNRDVMLLVPPVYRRYVQRYVDVVKSLKGSYFYGTPGQEEMNRLAAHLAGGTKEEKYAASATLEGIGTPAVPAIKQGIQKGDEWSLVYGATALAYLNEGDAADLVMRAAESADEGVRLEATRLMAQMSGRRVAQALKDMMYDKSRPVSLAAVKGLLQLSSDDAEVRHFSAFDLAAVPGARPGIIVDASARPLVVVAGVSVPLEGTIEIRLTKVALGSVDAGRVGVVIGAGAAADMTAVDATVENVISAVVRTDPSYEDFERLLRQLEDKGNLPYKITWLQ